MKNNSKVAFFGSSKFSVFCLEELKQLGVLPTLIITLIDKPKGRKMEVTKGEVKVWAEVNNLECLQPEKLTAEFLEELKSKNCDLFLVASYGKILPKALLEMPKYGTLNIHPSLLPKYRGPSPIQSQILNNDREVGVTLMLMDEKVDHGPIIAQEKTDIPNWPIKTEELKKLTAQTGAKILAKNLENWTAGKIKAQDQNHDEATFTKKIEKADGLIDLEKGDPYQNFLKIQAYSMWPQAYFFVEKNNLKIRVIVKDAEFKDGVLVIKRVLPEGKKEMSYEDFLRGLK